MISGNGMMAAYSMQAMPLHTSGRAILLFVNGFCSSDFLYTEEFYGKHRYIHVHLEIKIQPFFGLFIKVLFAMVAQYMYMFFTSSEQRTKFQVLYLKHVSLNIHSL